MSTVPPAVRNDAAAPLRFGGVSGYSDRVLNWPAVTCLTAPLGHFFKVAGWRLREDLLHLQAMGLTYAMLLALIPFFGRPPEARG